MLYFLLPAKISSAIIIDVVDSREIRPLLSAKLSNDTLRRVGLCAYLSRHEHLNEGCSMNGRSVTVLNCSTTCPIGVWGIIQTIPCICLQVSFLHLFFWKHYISPARASLRWGFCGRWNRLECEAVILRAVKKKEGLAPSMLFHCLIHRLKYPCSKAHSCMLCRLLVAF